MSGLYSEEMIYDEGYWEGLRVAWYHMFQLIHLEQRDFEYALQQLAILRDNARADFERHKEEDDE